MRAALSCVLLAACSATEPDRPVYDHQTATYEVKHAPVSVSSKPLTITPFFSPEHSTDTITALLQSAVTSIDIGTPGFSSWSGCTPFVEANHSCMKACTPEAQRADAFPIFAALLNAVHRGIKIRVLTNNYETPDCAGTISPLPFLLLNGIEVHYYASTTFLHTKFIIVDGKRASVSSINFSRTSFTRNREAGAIVEGAHAAPLLTFLQAVYEDDWTAGTPLKPVTAWTAAQLETIRNKTLLPVVLPQPSPSWADYYVTPAPSALSASATSVEIATAPDYAMATLAKFIGEAQHTLDVMVYQITEEEIADQLLKLARRGVTVRLLVSSSIYGGADCAAANQVYSKIAAAKDVSIEIRKTTRHYTYSHQKFWIVDGESVSWSTGNLSPTDLPPGSPPPMSFPPFGAPGWSKANRDFTLYVRGSTTFTAPFQRVFDNDRDPHDAFPSKVYPWTSQYQVSCGTGAHFRTTASGAHLTSFKAQVVGSHSTEWPLLQQQ